MVSRLPRCLAKGFHALLGVAAVALAVTHAIGAQPVSPEAETFFEREIRPVLVGICTDCHGPKKAKGGLRMDTLPHLLAGGFGGAALEPGKPEESLLIKAVRRTHEDLAMPPDEPLTPQQVAALEKWVLAGAFWPGSERHEAIEKQDPAELWSYQPLGKPQPPSVDDADWSRTAIDRFIKKNLDEAGLKPVEEAGKTTLLRRLHYDLTGLPPAKDEVRAFLADERPDAFSRVVEELLSRREYGERWGRHWLDLVRYADTAGDNSDFPVPDAWKYRDYVIDAFHRDMPYDQFLQEQLAGDLLNAEEGIPNPLAGTPRLWDRRPGNIPEERKAAGPEIPLTEQHKRRFIATGYLALSRRFGSEVARYPHHLTIEDTLDNLGKVFLGLSIGCARCHDHKFDAITDEDYYALYGMFESTRYTWPGIELSNPPRDRIPLVSRAEYIRTLQTIEPRIAPKRADVLEKWRIYDETWARYQANPKSHELHDIWWEANKQHWKSTQQEGAAILKHLPEMPYSFGVVDGDFIADTRLQHKGSPETPGAVIPRGFLAVLGGQTVPESDKHRVSGRLHLARWMTDPGTAGGQLVARVIANRVWQHHFGSGLVNTPNDFGVRGTKPSNPELLDWLARRLIESDWSLKALHRDILNTRVYRLASHGREENSRLDPENRLLWKHNRRRLDAESLRDTLLLLGGQLDRSAPSAPHPFPEPATWKFTQHEPFEADYPTRHRSIYVMMKRLRKDPFFVIFDGPDTSATTPVRNESVTAPQILYALNNETFHDLSGRFARRIIGEAPTDTARVGLAFLHSLGRTPAPLESRECLAFLAELREPQENSEPPDEGEVWSAFTRALLRANEFIYLD